jgi:chromosome segregation ATPase
MSTTTVESDLQERLRLAGSKFEAVHRQLSAKKIEFDSKKTSCSSTEFSAMTSEIQQLQLIEQEKKAELTTLEREYAVQLDAERASFERGDLLRQRITLEAELNAGQREIDILRGQITAAEQRIGTLIHQRNRILPQLALLPRTE